MPDINAERLQDLINVPEQAEASEVRSLAQLLVEAQDVLLVRNHQNRTLNQLTQDAGFLMETSERKHALLKQRVVTVSVGLALLGFTLYIIL